ncbi:GHMP kinase [Nocardiopsis sp. NRRL B-16309]|nr:GHMP kinase [Nocardiopsis sp. NRRL B-16309]
MGQATCHHGELLQGVFLDGDGRPVRGLVTLPMADPLTRAEFTPRPGTGPHRIAVDPPGRDKAVRAAALAAIECARATGRYPSGGDLRLTGGLPAGLGLGSSTSDVTATIRAVADAYGALLPPASVARTAVAAEGASDPVMLGERPVLFAQREGRVLEELGAALPELAVVGCLTGHGRPVDTMGLPGTVRSRDAAVYERLRAALRAAVADGDPAEVGRVSTESAILNQRVLPKEELGKIRGVARHCAAVGIQVAHSGNVAGVLFDATVPDLSARIDAAVSGLRSEGLVPTRVFSTPSRTHGERTWTTTYATLSADLT